MIDVDEICEKAEVYGCLRSNVETLSSHLPPLEGLFDIQNFTGEIKQFLINLQETEEEMEKFLGSIQVTQG
jgi:hypothetical protein